MADFLVPSGQFLKLTYGGLNTDTRYPFGIIGGSAQVADYSTAYVADLGPLATANNTGNARLIAIVPKNPPPVGGSILVNVTFTGHDSTSGAALNPLSISAQFNGAAAPPPPPTTRALNGNLEIASSSFDLIANAPADPGSDTVTF